MNGDDCNDMCLQDVMGRSRERRRMRKSKDSNKMDGDFDCDDMCIEELVRRAMNGDDCNDMCVQELMGKSRERR